MARMVNPGIFFFPSYQVSQPEKQYSGFPKVFMGIVHSNEQGCSNSVSIQRIHNLNTLLQRYPYEDIRVLHTYELPR